MKRYDTPPPQHARPLHARRNAASNDRVRRLPAKADADAMEIGVTACKNTKPTAIGGFFYTLFRCASRCFILSPNKYKHSKQSQSVQRLEAEAERKSANYVERCAARFRGRIVPQSLPCNKRSKVRC